MENDIIICRCQEVTRQEILDAIEQGATTVDGVKRRTRAGMGLCQGKTCERLDYFSGDWNSYGTDFAADQKNAGQTSEDWYPWR